MRFTKIKDDGTRVTLRWTEPAEGLDEAGAEVRCELETIDRPRPSFSEALQELAAHAVRLLELPSAYGKDVVVSGVTLKHEEEGLGVVLTCLKPIRRAQGPLVLNTPYCRIEGTGPDEAMERAIQSLTTEAMAFVFGARQQADLFDVARLEADPPSFIDRVVDQVVDEVNRGALGPGVTAARVPPSRRAAAAR